jgi:photosystem II stability/assembly factor-like uncharacterized protein
MCVDKDLRRSLRLLAISVPVSVFAWLGTGVENRADGTQTSEKQESSNAGTEEDKDKRLRELQKQVEALQKDLHALRRGSASAPATVESFSQSQSEKSLNAPSVETKGSHEQRTEGKKLEERSLQASAAASPSERTFKPEWLKSLAWRSIGPAAMGGRIVQIAVVDSDPCCYYVATASGGLFKTTNHGTTFSSIFDHQSSISIGDVAVAPSNPQVIWVGTGEHNARNSVSWGDGVYKSSDAGKSWQNMGLKDSFQIGRIVLHPRNPDIVYVGALGRLWGENEERGLYKTIDGGRTWDRVLYVDAKTGCIDLALNPDDPEVVIAAMYERQRGIYDDGDPIKRWGPGSGLFKSVNGGKDWIRLSHGLPTVAMGRIGISVYKKNPKIVYAIIETEKIGTGPPPPRTEGPPAYMGIQGEGEEGGAKLTTVSADGPADNAGLREGDVVIELDAKAVTSYADLTDQIQLHKAGDKVKVRFQRDNKTNELELTFGERPAGGGSRGAAPAGPYSSALGGQRENSQDSQGQDGFQTGGVYRSSDGGETWNRVNSLNPRPFYFSRIYVDPNDDNKVYVLGISAYRSSDAGKTFSSDLARGVHADHHALWIDPRDGRRLLLGSDGGLYASYDRGVTWEHADIMPLGQFYHVAVDTRRPYRVYGGLQDNGSWGGPSMMLGRGPTNEDWVTVGGGDGFTCQVDPNDPDLVYCTSQYGNMGRINVHTGERRRIRPQAEQGRRFRFNWKTPFVLSHHNSKIFYAAGNYVFRSLDRGDKLRAISPEIAATNRGTASALAESPLNSDLLYAGTDDGALWVTRNAGHQWTNITEAIRDLAAHGCISSIEPSRYQAGRCYVAIDAHRADSTAPFVFVTEDYGQTWRSLRANLPVGSVRTLREDIQNENLLYVGTEFGAWFSLDRGGSWVRLNNNLPSVAVHEFAQPRTANELVAATHGRSIWILDVTPLRYMTRDVYAANAHLFRPGPAVAWGNPVGRSMSGHKRFTGENPPDGAAIHYLVSAPANDVRLKVLDGDGKTMREFTASGEPGLYRVVWDLRRSQQLNSAAAGQGGPRGSQSGGQSESTAGSATTGQRVRSATATPRVRPGTYRVVMTIDEKEISQPILVEPDPQLAPSIIAQEEEDDWR